MLLLHFLSSQVALVVKNPSLPLQKMQETQVQSLGWEDPLEEEMAPTPVCLPGKSHGQRSLVGCSSWAHEEMDMIK